MDRGAATRIARLAVDAPGDRVLEIGAGTGTLTFALLALGGDVTAFDIDPDLVALLREQSALNEAHIELADALAYDYATFAAGDDAWRVAGNLPYNIATPLLLQLAGLALPPQRVVVMIQRDVAERLSAKPNAPAYGSLTLAIEYFMQVERKFTLSPASFFPKPGVDSTVVVLSRRNTPAVQTRDAVFLLKVTRAAFAYRRKKLANSLALALGIPRETVAAALHSLGINPEIRGEQLDLSAFAALADQLAP